MTFWSFSLSRRSDKPLGAVASLYVLTTAVGVSQPAAAQFVEVGPSTSLSTVPSAPGNLNSNTLVTGMSSQGNPVFGAANMILQSPADPSTYWAATVSGGVWETTDGGNTWKPTTDSQPALQIGAIALDAADPKGKTLYAGTGAYSAGLPTFSPTTVLLKSTDGGCRLDIVGPDRESKPLPWIERAAVHRPFARKRKRALGRRTPGNHTDLRGFEPLTSAAGTLHR